MSTTRQFSTSRKGRHSIQQQGGACHISKANSNYRYRGKSNKFSFASIILVVGLVLFLFIYSVWQPDAAYFSNPIWLRRILNTWIKSRYQGLSSPDHAIPQISEAEDVHTKSLEVLTQLAHDELSLIFHHSTGKHSVIAKSEISEGEIVEICPTIPVPVDIVSSVLDLQARDSSKGASLANYAFDTADEELALLTLGWCMLYQPAAANSSDLQEDAKEQEDDGPGTPALSSEFEPDFDEETWWETVERRWNVRIGGMTFDSFYLAEAMVLPFSVMPDLVVYTSKAQGVSKGEALTLGSDLKAGYHVTRGEGNDITATSRPQSFPACQEHKHGEPVQCDSDTPHTIHALARIPDVAIQPSSIDGAGRGLFSKTAYSKGETIEIAPVLLIEGQQSLQKSLLRNYVFSAETAGVDGYHNDVFVMPLGYGGLYNHNSIPNVQIEWLISGVEDESVDSKLQHYKDFALYWKFIASKEIMPGEELCISYGDRWENEWNNYVSGFVGRVRPFMDQPEKLAEAVRLMPGFEHSPAVPASLSWPSNQRAEDHMESSEYARHFNADLFISSSIIPDGGRGVFTAIDLEKEEIVEYCPAIIVPRLITASKLGEYVYAADEEHNDTMALLGWCMMYNHAPESNLDVQTIASAANEFNEELLDSSIDVQWPDDFSWPFSRRHMMGFTAKSDISSNSELFSNYGKQWFAVRSWTERDPPVQSHLEIPAFQRVLGSKSFISRSDIAGAGRGVFSKGALPADEIIEMSPVLFLHSFFANTSMLGNYVYGVPQSPLNALPLGHGAMYNHGGNNSNLRVTWSVKDLDNGEWMAINESNIDPEKRPIPLTRLYLTYITQKQVAEGEELTIDYGHEWEQMYGKWKAGLEYLVLNDPGAVEKYEEFRHQIMLPRNFPWPDMSLSSVRQEVVLTLDDAQG